MLVFVKFLKNSFRVSKPWPYTCITMLGGFMRTSELIKNEVTGQKYLKVFYDPNRDDFNEVINQALSRHKIKRGEMTILCLPMKGNNQDDQRHNRHCTTERN